jgi:hypothetical protein
MQNLRRCAGYEVQYFAAVEAQRRLAPHLHAALRGAIPRALLRTLASATYHQLWWPPHDTPIYDVGELPVWSEVHRGYLSPSGELLPTWDQALDALAVDPEARPAHVVRFGQQVRIDGIIPGPDGERAIGYLCKYLTKDMATSDVDDDDELTPAQRAHLARLHEQTRWLPCSPECSNWLRYGIQPRNPRPGMTPGNCGRRAHDQDNVGHGGRRVLVSRRWTGKTLARHRADRAEVVRQVLEQAGVEVDDHRIYSADQQRPDGQPRWRWSRIEWRHLNYAEVIAAHIDTRRRWRDEYDRAKQLVTSRAGPPDPELGTFGNSATRQGGET